MIELFDKTGQLQGWWTGEVRWPVGPGSPGYRGELSVLLIPSMGPWLLAEDCDRAGSKTMTVHCVRLARHHFSVDGTEGVKRYLILPDDMCASESFWGRRGAVRLMGDLG